MKLMTEAGTARGLADALIDELKPLCAQVQIAGSLRRGKALVGDVEIVAVPHQAGTVLARLDNWVMSKRITKALYGKETRWGQKYRGFVYEGVRFELFLADAHNFGYIYWLRTGPGESNHLVMQLLKWKAAPYSPDGGYWWQDGRKISVPDEAELFRLLGMQHVVPVGNRSEYIYRTFMTGRWVTPVFVEETAPEPETTQGRLF